MSEHCEPAPHQPGLDAEDRERLREAANFIEKVTGRTSHHHAVVLRNLASRQPVGEVDPKRIRSLRYAAKSIEDASPGFAVELREMADELASPQPDSQLEGEEDDKWTHCVECGKRNGATPDCDACALFRSEAGNEVHGD